MISWKFEMFTVDSMEHNCKWCDMPASFKLKTEKYDDDGDVVKSNVMLCTDHAHTVEKMLMPVEEAAMIARD